MPLPLKPEENIYIDHKILDGTYSMPTKQAGFPLKQFVLLTLEMPAYPNHMCIIVIALCPTLRMTDM